MSDKRILVFSTVIVFIFRIFSFLLGYFRDVLVTRNFGASHLTDAWYIASNVPEFLFKFLMFGAFGASFFPVFIDLISQKKEEEGWRIASSVINFFGLVLAGASIIGIIFSNQLVYVFAPGFNANTHHLAVGLTRLLLSVLAFMGINGLLIGIYRSYFNFVVPGACSLLVPLSIIVSIVLFSKTFGVYALAWGTIAGFLLSFFVLVVFLGNKINFYKFIIDFRNPQVRRIYLLMLPLIGAEIIGKGISVVDQMFASTLPTGSVTSLFLANRIVGVPVEFFSMTFATVIFPFLSYNTALKNKEEFKSNLLLTIKLSLLMLIPSLVGIVIFGQKLIRIIFEHGKFTAYDARVTYVALFYLSLGLIVYGLKPILTRCFYAMQKNWIIFKFEIIGFSLNIVLDYILMKYMGLGGIALATSIVTLITVSYLVKSLKKEIEINLLAISPFILKVLFAAFVMGLVGYFSDNLVVKFFNIDLLINQLFYLVILIVLNVIVFFGVLFLIKVEEVKLVWQVLKKNIFQKVTA
ncbi:MAG: murein biosynthesis integral membrane protein MurJ [Candidatus Omnitrophica bacterium]|nr:murein biosynthesis integral membrane protein MurJ [Candidatus Omnitrophota bacterium]